MRKPSSNIYRYAIHSIKVLAVAGFLTMSFGMVTKLHRLIMRGVGIFLLGVAVWGLANGGAFIWGIFRTVHKEGGRAFLRDTIEHPWSAGLYALLMVFLLCTGVFVLWGALRDILSP